jgi:hypothetical protein
MTVDVLLATPAPKQVVCKHQCPTCLPTCIAGYPQSAQPSLSFSDVKVCLLSWYTNAVLLAAQQMINLAVWS